MLSVRVGSPQAIFYSWGLLLIGGLLALLGILLMNTGNPRGFVLIIFGGINFVIGFINLERTEDVKSRRFEARQRNKQQSRKSQQRIDKQNLVLAYATQKPSKNARRPSGISSNCHKCGYMLFTTSNECPRCGAKRN